MNYALIEKPKLFVESLNRAVSELVTPYVDGVDSIVVFEKGSKGCVLTYIPESEKTPHRSLSDNLYYLRAGDSFRKMEHFQLEDMFGRRMRPKLSMQISCPLSHPSRPDATYKLDISLRNEGRAISQLFGFDLEFPDMLNRPNHGITGRENLITHSDKAGIIVIKYRNVDDNDKSPMYPGETKRITPHNYRLGHLQFLCSKQSLRGWKDRKLSYTIYSDSMQPIQGEFLFGDLFDPKEIMEAL